MKYVIVIPDGAADEPVASLGGKTPLQAARKPALDRLARGGIVGLTNNVPESLTPASDVATLSLFGYDPLDVYTGRAPLEAAAMGVALAPGDWAVRCNLVTVEGGAMTDYTAGHISSDEAAELVRALQARLGGPAKDVDAPGAGGEIEFHAGVSYRHLMVYRSRGAAPFSAQTRSQAPHDIPDLPIAGHLPDGPGAALLRSLMDRSEAILRDHAVNERRRQRGERPATRIWLWGQGHAPRLVPFAEKYGCRGAIISAVDLVRGVGVLIGWRRLDVPGATGYLDTDYRAKGRAALEALAGHDLVCVHVEAPDEASHEGKPDEKVKAIERIDEFIVGPLADECPRRGAWRMLVAPDHRTTLRTRAHARGPVPFVIAGAGIPRDGNLSYDEVVAQAAGRSFARGHDLMPFFLG